MGNEVLNARDIMVTTVVTFQEDADIFEAIDVLIRRGISGGPVVDGDGQLVGILSEKDCLSLLASGTFHELPHTAVGHYMSANVLTVAPERDIYYLASLFLKHVYRRLPVVEGGKLVGIVARRDVLVGIERMRREGAAKRYPDYRRPS